MQIINKLGYKLNERENNALHAIVEERGRGSESTPPAAESADVVVTNDKWYWDDGNPITLHSKDIHDKAREIDFQNNPDELRAVFYPAASMDDAALKHALLYFDKVCVMTPDEIGSHSPIGNRDDFHPAIPKLNHVGGASRGLDDGKLVKLVSDIHQFNTDTWNLRRDGYLYFLSPSRNVTPQFHQAIQADLDSNDFVSIVNASGIGPFYIGTSKAFGFHYNTMVSEQAAKGHDQIIAREEFEEMITCLKEGQTAKGIQILFSLFKDTLFGGYGMVKVSPELGAAVLLNQAIFSCHTFGLTPFTDAQLYQDLLLEKFKRAAGSHVLGQYKAELQLSSAIMARQVMDMHLPRLDLRSFEDVIEQKEELADELLRFRAEITKFAAQVRATPYDESYQKEIERIVAAEINPAIEDIKAKIRSAKRGLVSKVLKGAKVGTVPIAATLLAGMPLPYVLALSAGVIAIEALWDVECASRDVADQNGLSFLLRVS